MSLSEIELREQFGINVEEFAFMAEHPEEFVPTGRSMTVRLANDLELAEGIRTHKTQFMATVNGKAVSASAVLKAARLTRMSKIDQETREGKKYLMVSGVLRPVILDVRVYPKGNDEGITLQELLRSSINAGRTAKGLDEVGEDRFLGICAGMGLDFAGGMPMLWQHFGANPETSDEAINWFEAQGARDAYGAMANPGRIRRAYELPEGLEVTSIELGRMDRSMSSRGQGFIDIVEAVTANFKRIVAQRETLRNLRAKATTLAGENKPNEDAIRELNQQIDALEAAARSWTGNWGGTQQRREILPDQSFVETDIWDGVSVPVGRITVIGKDGKPFEMNFWQRNDTVGPASTTEVPEGAISSEDVNDSGEEPF